MNEEHVRKGRRSEQFLQDEVFATALEKMKGDLHWEFENSKPDETAKRENCWAQLRAIENFKNELTKMIDNGKVAQRAIERAQKNLV
jgi:signal transduction protein with GAF and PtsI domain